MRGYTTVIAGYDISHLSGYIHALERATGQDDGLEKYSLNFNDVSIGYDQTTKKVFGKVLYNYKNENFTEEGTRTSLSMGELIKMQENILKQYKLFLIDHTKIDRFEEPDFSIHFVQYWR